LYEFEADKKYGILKWCYHDYYVFV